MGPGFTKKYLHYLEMLFTCNAPPEEDILDFLCFQWCRITLPVSGMINADNYVHIIQRKVTGDM